jgi:hypothetical protein
MGYRERKIHSSLIQIPVSLPQSSPFHFSLEKSLGQSTAASHDFSDAKPEGRGLRTGTSDLDMGFRTRREFCSPCTAWGWPAEGTIVQMGLLGGWKEASQPVRPLLSEGEAHLPWRLFLELGGDSPW